MVPGSPSATMSCSTVPPKGAGTSATACSGPSTDAFYDYTYVGGALTVQRAATTTTLTTSVTTAAVGQAVTLQASETVVAPGQAPFTAAVEFFDGSALVGAANVVAGQARLTLTSLGVGPHAFTAAYREGADLQGSTSAPGAGDRREGVDRDGALGRTDFARLRPGGDPRRHDQRRGPAAGARRARRWSSRTAPRRSRSWPARVAGPRSPRAPCRSAATPSRPATSRVRSSRRAPVRR